MPESGSDDVMSIRSRTPFPFIVLMLAPLLSAGACARPDGAEPALEHAATEGPAGLEDVRIIMEPLDSIIFEEKMAWAQAQRLDTADIGSMIAAIGRTFVGTPYTPGTLEADGPEGLVVNLRELDCVTFVETTLAMVRVIRAGTPDFDSFRRELARIRYRDGVLSGYPSRLHYFSEWIGDNDAKGVARDITADLGGRIDPEAISFMTAHADAYRQLADTAVFAEIRRIEATLSGRDRYMVPQDAIEAAAAGIRDGDIIAATSTLPGLDVAHTGFALWVDGRLHLMHAPLVGSVVEISERPLADRIRGIGTQDGIMVARPL
jgi:hypothetical protein